MTVIERVQTAVVKLTRLAEHEDLSVKMVMHAVHALRALEGISGGAVRPEATVDAIRISIADLRRLSRRLHKTRRAIDPSLRQDAGEILALLLPLAPEVGNGKPTEDGVDEPPAAGLAPLPAPVHQQEWPATKILPKGELARPTDFPAAQASPEGSAMPRTEVLPAHLLAPAAPAPDSSTPAFFEITSVLPKTYRPRLAALERSLPPPLFVPSVIRPILPLPPAPKKKRPPPTLVVPKPASALAVRAALLGLDRAYRGIWSVFSSRCSTVADLGTAEAELVKTSQCLGWMGPSRVEPARAVLAEQDSPYDRMITSVALAHAGVPGSVDGVLTALADAYRSGVTVERGSLVLNQLADTCIDLRAAFDATAESSLKTMLVPAMVERGMLDSAALDGLLDSQSDEVASQAAQALAWIGDREQGERLLRKARSASSSERANAFLFGAVALGEYEAVSEVKVRLAQGEHPAPLLLDALAISGDESDALWLAEMATHVDEHADLLIATATALGGFQLYKRLIELQSDGSGRTHEVIRSLLQGEGSVPEAARLLRGDPWSVQGLLRILSDPDQPLALRRRSALELSVRTGKRPPAYFSEHATVKAWPNLTEAWTAHFGRLGQRLPPGQWYYFGRPFPAARLS
jgi:hypothetical protein